MSDAQLKKIKQVCKCVNCGNEAEMELTCQLETSEESGPVAAAHDPKPTADHAHRVKASGTCSHCGNEADMWVDI